MRSLAVGLVAALLATSAPADAARHAAKREAQKSTRKASGHGGKAGKQRKTRAARLVASRGHERSLARVVSRGQSVGAPWDGRLQHPAQLLPGDGYVLRRPGRAFGTEAAVAQIERAIAETLDEYPDVHVLAIGDLSAPTGGQITEHRSHQSGRDADIGLFFLEQPAGYPASFVRADADNLDCAATFKLIESFLASADDDGGVQMIFLDFEVQGLLYAWALEQGISERRLARIFQYPHGRGASEGLVRHEPNHDNHLHVRFKCPSDDSACE